MRDLDRGLIVIEGGNSLVVTVNVCGIIALPLETAGVEADGTPASGEVCGIGICRLAVAGRGLDRKILHEHIFRVESHDTHSRLGVYRHMVEDRIVAIKYQYRRAEVEAVVDVCRLAHQM